MPARCRLCPSTKLPIRGHGPVPSRILCIGEGPGKVEDQKRLPTGEGTPFIGDSGTEFSDLYLPLAGLRRHMVRVVNTVACANASYTNPSDDLAQCCSLYWLPEEFRLCRPLIVITMGAIALRTLFPHLNLDLEHHHGTPVRTHVAPQYGNWTGILVPMYHPAAGLRTTQYMTAQLEDWAALRPLIDGDAVTLTHDSHPTPDYHEAVTVDDLDQYLDLCPDSWRPSTAMDTEYVPGSSPYCMSFSLLPGTAVVVKSTNTPVLSRLQRWVWDHRAHVDLHYALADLAPLEAMGITLPTYSDTCMDAYHLGNLPIGLKLLAWRQCGLRMQDFDDLARPYALEQVLLWAATLVDQLVVPPCTLGEPNDIAWLTTDGVYIGQTSPYSPPIQPERGVLGIPQARKLYREWLESQPELLSTLRGKVLIPDPLVDSWRGSCNEVLVKTVNSVKTGSEKLASKLTRLIGDLASTPDLNPWKRWGEWSEEDCSVCTKLAGPMPTMNVTQIPWSKVVPYSARDADATLRVRDRLRVCQREFRRLAKRMN